MSISPLPAVMLQKKVKQSEARSVEVRLVVGGCPILAPELPMATSVPPELSRRGGASYHVQKASISDTLLMRQSQPAHKTFWGAKRAGGVICGNCL
ncbi:unnamed protein product [Fusarium venenatum]|uniref:Uncharacterized protein n=1 Tax=Fusarium venenatum TaxID=56646 RepID=A0A2L2U2I4_9HYPO|nr:uncharacterized protein FVRRES_09887 [Fusarium venenatum]CEI69810.1 unnamed protein product [Fusarium venenatum]